MKLLKSTVLLFVSITTLFCGCTPTPTPQPNTTVTASNCLLETQKDNGLEVMKVDYDAQNRIVKEYFFDPNGSGTLYKTVEYTYSADGKIIKTIVRDNLGTSAGYSLYEYNAVGKLIFIKMYNTNGVIEGQKAYLYDNNTRLIRENNYSVQGGTGLLVLSSEHTTYQYNGNDNKPSRMVSATIQGSAGIANFSYDANDNITNIAGYSNVHSSDSSNFVHTGDIVRTFDTKKSALISFSGLNNIPIIPPITDLQHSYHRTGTGTISPNGIIGKNNVLTMVETLDPLFFGNNNGSVKTTTYNYEFDANGNPIKQTVLPTSGSLKNYTFTYRCY